MELERTLDPFSTADGDSTAVSLAQTTNVPSRSEPIEWEELDGDAKIMRIDRPTFNDKPIELRVELGRTYMDRDEALHVRSGTLLPLDNATSEPVAVYAGGRLFAWGEAVAVEGKLGVRILELASSGANY